MSATSTYENIRGQVLATCTNCSQPDLTRLKAQFSDQINSRRRLDNITTVAELVRILEKRDVLNPGDIGCLQTIARVLYKMDLLARMSQYNGLSHQVVRVTVPSPPVGPVLTQHRTSAHEHIHTLICDEIGFRWKDLARALSVGEGKIDELEDRYRHLSDRVREILRHHERNYTPQTFTWFPLLDALDKSRRNDLRKRVQRILDQNQQEYRR